MGELSDFDIEQDVTPEQAVVENQIHKKVLFVECKSLLARLEQEALPISRRNFQSD